MAKRSTKTDEAKRKSAAKRLTEDDKDRIVELKLSRISTRNVAKEVGCAPNTVTNHWHAYLDGISDERRERLDRKQSEMIAYFDSIAANARREQNRIRANRMLADDDRAKALARLYSEERQALRALSSVAGYDAPTRIVATFDTMTDDEARAILAELDDDV